MQLCFIKINFIVRGKVAGVLHSAGGRFYANGSTILYECNDGFIRSYTGVSHDLSCFMVWWWTLSSVVVSCRSNSLFTILSEPLMYQVGLQPT